ncbi:MAG TPA: TIGR03435 family protein [Pyrinomonadaceae bacterium]|nr:TIGR03435 family protein [Pyrinomonadaceae bacterium]
MIRNHAIWVSLALIVASIFSSLKPTHAQVPSIRVGDTAPEIKLEKLLQAPSDAQTSATSLKGKVVVLEFWATWCLPCVPAIAHLNQVAAKFKDKPVQFIAITDEGDESLVTKFLNEQPVRGWVGLDIDGSVFGAYKPGGRPHTVLVDRNWKIAAITYAEKVTAAVVDDLLAGKPVSLPLKPLGDGSEADLTKTGVELFQATIQPSTGSGPLYGGMLNAPGRIESDGLPLLPAIVTAYRTSNSRIVESVPLPKDSYKFKVVVPKGREELLYPVFQQALEVTFGLKVRREMREVDVFVLRRDSNQGSSLNPSQASNSAERNDRGFLRAKKQPIKKLADLLEGMFLRAPVVDETGLTAEYDWELPYNRASNNVLLDAIRTQLGLEVVRDKRRIEFLVIEGVGLPAVNTGKP